VREALGEVAQSFSAGTDLLGVQPQVAGVTQHLLEDELGLLDLVILYRLIGYDALLTRSTFDQRDTPAEYHRCFTNQLVVNRTATHKPDHCPHRYIFTVLSTI
jgi:hypothetical protein